MNLSKYEAYITKKDKIKFGSDCNDAPFLILNPIKGNYSTTKSRILKILELNPNIVLGVKFDNGDKKWIATAGIDEDNATNILVYYNTYEQAKGIRSGDNYTLMSISDRLSNIEKFIENCDINICQVIRKGVLM